MSMKKFKDKKNRLRRRRRRRRRRRQTSCRVRLDPWEGKRLAGQLPTCS